MFENVTFTSRVAKSQVYDAILFKAIYRRRMFGSATMLSTKFSVAIETA